jgi:uncharacterized protein
MSQSRHSETPSSGNPLKTIFINREGELRSGWRIVIFLLITIILFQLLAGLFAILGILIPVITQLLKPMDTSESGGWVDVARMGFFTVLTFIPILIANGICARWLERRSFASTGFQFHKGWLKDFALGLALGGAALTIAVGIAAAAGATTFTVKNTDFAGLAQAFAILFIILLFAAAFEEAMVRGFVFQALEHNLGAVAAVSITSAFFGVMHLGNQNVTLFSTFNTIIAGVWLGIAYLMTRSLWLATALHVAWNFVMGFIFGLPVSGIKLMKNFAWLDGSSTKGWISGADYCPEGGLAATIALLLCTLVIWKSGLFQTTQEMTKAIEHGKRGEASLGIANPQTDLQPGADGAEQR